MFAQLLDPLNYLFTFHARSTIVVGAAAAGLGTYVLVKERGSRIGLLFWFVTVCMGVWLVAAGLVYASLREPEALVWIRASQAGVTFIPSTILALSMDIAQRAHEHRRLIAACFACSALFCLIALFTDLHIDGLTRYSWGFYPRYGPLGIAFVVFFFGIMIYTLGIYWGEYRSSANERHRRRFKGLLIAFGVGYLASSDFLAAFGKPVYPFGYLSIIPFLFTNAYVITRYRLADITMELVAGQVLEIMQGAVVVVDLAGKVRVVNRAAQELLGYEKAEILNRNLSSVVLLPPDLDGPDGRPVLNRETVWTDRSGCGIDVSLSASPLTDRDGAPAGTVYVAHNITERKQANRRLEHLAMYDTLTGLPNRTLFFDRVNQLLALARRNDYVLALLFMDLDRFKTVNDTLGHEAGDLLLREVARRMTSTTRKADTVARMGGDEFVGICGRITAEGDASVIAEKIIAVLSRPFTIRGTECRIGVSIGISLYPRDGDDVETLVGKADAAMYRVKDGGAGGFAYFSRP